jgi:serine/threonine-protein kinase
MATISAKKIKKLNGRKIGDCIGDWELLYVLGRGGNGDVWAVQKDGGSPHALKVLHRPNSEALERFRIEIEALEKVNEISGIVPLVESHKPDTSSTDAPWFVMPLAETFERYRDRTKFVDLIKNFVNLADTLCELHKNGYSHRDIKPANILWLDGRLCFSDFGLVKYPDREELTQDKRDIGAKFTMAPEMRRTAASSDGQPADVYSFAKSLWIAISRNGQGFDGQYIPDAVLALKPHIEGWYATPLDQLMAECTNTDPDQRPKIATVRDRLNEWIAVSEDFQSRNELEWIELASKLFPMGTPASAAWVGIDEICSVLSAVAGAPGLNHMFYPSGGGMTLKGVSRSYDEGAIELHISDRMVDLVRPTKLTFESFGKELEWSYFRLEIAETSPSGIEGALHANGISEELVEVAPGNFVHPQYWDYGELNGHPLPDTARRINRVLNGSLVFFSTTSVYNQSPGTYDARHNKMSEKEFRSYIEQGAESCRRRRGSDV